MLEAETHRLLLPAAGANATLLFVPVTRTGPTAQNDGTDALAPASTSLASLVFVMYASVRGAAYEHVPAVYFSVCGRIRELKRSVYPVHKHV